MEGQQSTLDEMVSQIEEYKASGKHEAASRLQEQMALMEQKFIEVQKKFERFRSPTNLEPRLSRALRELGGIEEATCLLELASEDPEAIEGQLKHCLVSLHPSCTIYYIINVILSSLQIIPAFLSNFERNQKRNRKHHRLWTKIGRGKECR